jgi:hypothetical protein
MGSFVTPPRHEAQNALRTSGSGLGPPRDKAQYVLRTLGCGLGSSAQGGKVLFGETGRQ